ncbi:Uma2 family endonuclease [Paenibacillus alkalitolerans]|uniref:Uma2 family endonuclease n=1 Tax=Paenibacillus alkalitolerans TaxID=2799335 RepID=UPI0018F4AF3A|nr:Uma2 family endonuclease [Paenibacillus alkalitolerans]
MKKKNVPGIAAESPVTYDVYASLPDDGNRYEVADGVLELMSPAPGTLHQVISYELQSKLNSDCRQEYIIINAPIDVILSDTEVRQPDLVMVHRSRMSLISKRGIEGVPDLVVEIMSSHSRKRDKVHKTKAYAKYGVPEYWIVDLSNYTLEQYVLKQGIYELIDVYEGEETVRSDKLACVSFSMGEIVRQLPDVLRE